MKYFKWRQVRVLKNDQILEFSVSLFRHFRRNIVQKILNLIELYYLCIQQTLPFTLYTYNLTMSREQIKCKRCCMKTVTGYVNQDFWFKRGLRYL